MSEIEKLRGYEEVIRVIESSFFNAADKILSDPLMDCFKDTKESQNFMFDRMREIFKECITRAGDLIINTNTTIRQDKGSIKHQGHEYEHENQEVEKLKKNLSQKNFEISELKLKLDDYQNNQFEHNILGYDDLKSIQGQDGSELSHIEIIKNLNFQLKKAVSRNEKLLEDKEKAISDLNEQLNLQEQKINQLESIIESSDKNGAVQDTIKELEAKLRQSKQFQEDNRQKIEEITYVKDQLKESVVNLKLELKETTQKLSQERQKKHEFEISIINLKDQISELEVQNVNFQSDNEKLIAQMESILDNSKKLEGILKIEKRQNLRFQREAEEAIFSKQAAEKELQELTLSYRDQIDVQEEENRKMEQRLKKMIEEKKSNFSQEKSSKETLIQE